MDFYHGTTDMFNMKMIKPAQQTNNLREEWRKKLINKVFFTTSLMSAQKYAKKAAKKYGGNPIVYKVKPLVKLYIVSDSLLGLLSKV